MSRNESHSETWLKEILAEAVEEVKTWSEGMKSGLSDYAPAGRQSAPMKAFQQERKRLKA